MGTYRIDIMASDDTRGIQASTHISSRRLLGGRTIQIRAGRGHISGKEPTIMAIVDAITKKMGIKKIVNDANNAKQSILLTIGKPEFEVVFRKNGNRYSLNGQQATLDILEKALARCVLRSCYLDDSEESYDQLEEYLYRCITLPENITYVIENKLPYIFYERNETNITKHECRMNVKQIADFEFAIEVSGGIWGTMGLKDLNTFVDTYLYNKRRGQWVQISPQELYFKTVGTRPSEAQVKVMKEFLKQNRKQDIVEKRAMELFDDMVRDYETIKTGMRLRPGTTTGDKIKVMYVRGKVADWMIVDNCSKSGTQDVGTYILTNGMDNNNGRTAGWNSNMATKEKTMRPDVFWSGPICIDNMQSGASVGDQFASRAFACMNDEMTIGLVSTIRNYVSDAIWDKATNKKIEGHKVRLDWDALP